MTVDPATALPDVPASPQAPRRGVVALLIADGALCAILSVLFLGLYIGPVPFPITILLAACVNLVLVMAVHRETGSTRTALWPLVAWGVAFLLCLMGGPGSDQLVMADWRMLLLPIAALGAGGAYLFSARIKAITAATRQPAPQP
ncbi:MAG: hypothetical protein GXY65_04065 [Rhodococcus sp.]|uniref:hypothetical protein n=1 Tax=Rhodococcus TaxID=1827 RepID=UPI0016B0702C|nr:MULTISPECIES: hypothetical protein [Rhodococcus]NLV78514.1 hypothetical protein [Rhodococcus sp. (in: high G+C Gram-positive bacteria)]